jgi:hypothetical protein
MLVQAWYNAVSLIDMIHEKTVPERSTGRFNEHTVTRRHIFQHHAWSVVTWTGE